MRFNARQVHLCCALWAIRALMGVLSSVYSVNVIFDSPVCRQLGEGRKISCLTGETWSLFSVHLWSLASSSFGAISRIYGKMCSVG